MMKPAVTENSRTTMGEQRGTLPALRCINLVLEIAIPILIAYGDTVQKQFSCGIKSQAFRAIQGHGVGSIRQQATASIDFV